MNELFSLAAFTQVVERLESAVAIESELAAAGVASTLPAPLPPPQAESTAAAIKARLNPVGMKGERRQGARGLVMSVSLKKIATTGPWPALGQCGKRETDRVGTTRMRGERLNTVARRRPTTSGESRRATGVYSSLVIGP